MPNPDASPRLNHHLVTLTLLCELTWRQINYCFLSSFTLHYLIFNFHIFLYIYNVFSLAHIVLFFLLRFLTKKDCLNAMDPYCGWNRNKEECTTAPNRNPRVATWQQNVLSCPVLTDPVDGVWTAWSAWDQCAFSNPDRRVDSGGDYCMCRRRACTAPPPANGGAGCEGPGLVVTNCTQHGQWTHWSEWSGCSQSCGVGLKTRQRYCGRNYSTLLTAILR